MSYYLTLTSVQDGLLKIILLYDKCLAVLRTCSSMKRQLLSSTFPATLYQIVFRVLSSLIDLDLLAQYASAWFGDERR